MTTAAPSAASFDKLRTGALFGFYSLQFLGVEWGLWKQDKRCTIYGRAGKQEGINLKGKNIYCEKKILKG
jgi:hypothetical protein